MTTAMARPMPFDGQYAAAQLWKLDSIKGRYIPLSMMVADYLMLPAFPSARIKDRAEQYDRMPHATYNQTSVHLLAHEDLPRHLSEHALIRCCGWRTDGDMPIYITYYADVPTYLAQREEVFGATAPFRIFVDDRLTNEENAFLSKWRRRYRCPYPYVYGHWNVPYTRTATWISPEVHPQLVALDAKRKEHFRLWSDAIVPKPDDDDDIVYNERIYVGGLLNTNVVRP